MNKSFFASLFTLFAVTAQAAPVSAPYTNDFSSSVADFAEYDQGSGSFGLNTTDGWYQFVPQINGNRMAGVLDVTGFYGNDFTVSTNFAYQTGTTTVSAGIVLSPTVALDEYILIDWQYNFADGTEDFRLANIGGSGGSFNTLNERKEDGAINTVHAAGTNNFFSLTVEGVYTGASLALTATLSDGTNSDVLTGTIDTTSEFNLNTVGLTARTSGLNSTVYFDDIDVTVVPEPSSLVLLGISLGCLLFLNRKKRLR